MGHDCFVSHIWGFFLVSRNDNKENSWTATCAKKSEESIMEKSEQTKAKTTNPNRLKNPRKCEILDCVICLAEFSQSRVKTIVSLVWSIANYSAGVVL